MSDKRILSDEELERIKKVVEHGPLVDGVFERALLSHIDAQAEEIERLKQMGYGTEVVPLREEIERLKRDLSNEVNLNGITRTEEIKRLREERDHWRRENSDNMERLELAEREKNEK